MRLFKSIIGFLRSLFYRKLRFLGRCGIIYKKDSTWYFIDSEILFGEYDVVMWAKSVCYYDDNKKHIDLTKAQRKQIAEEIKARLEWMAYKVDYDDEGL